MIAQIEAIKKYKYHFYWGIPEKISFTHESPNGFFALAEMEKGVFELFWAVNNIDQLKDIIKLAQKSVPHFRFRVAAPLKELTVLADRVKALGYSPNSFHIGFRLNHLTEYPAVHHPGVKEASLADLGILKEMEINIFPSMNLSIEEWRYWLTDESSQCLLYIQDSMPVGFILLQTQSSHGFIRNLGVYEPFRGKGIGESLLKDGLFNLKINGAKCVMLWVEANNTPAINLYKKHGFIQDEKEAEMVFKV